MSDREKLPGARSMRRIRARRPPIPGAQITRNQAHRYRIPTRDALRGATIRLPRLGRPRVAIARPIATLEAARHVQLRDSATRVRFRHKIG
jgi:hypothetical protein